MWFGPVVPHSVTKGLIAELGAHQGVAVVHWPRDAGHVEHLARLGLPRLLLVGCWTNAPDDNGPLQDWLLWPATREEVHCRLMALYKRAVEGRTARWPGRAIAAAAAITCYEVGTIKHVPGVRTYAVSTVGPAPRPDAVTIAGKHCESGDIVVQDARLPADLAVGDIVATSVTGAYGYSMASNYNKQCRPPVVFARDGDYRVVVRRETYDDLLRLG